MQLLTLKIDKLEQLLRLKDAKIQSLNKKVMDAALRTPVTPPQGQAT